MFRRDKDNTDSKKGNNTSSIEAPPIKPFTAKGTHTPTKVPSLAAGSLNVPSPVRHMNISSIPGRHNHLDHPHQGDSDSKRLAACQGHVAGHVEQVLEGKVEVTVNKARLLEVASSGIFKGSAHVDDAIISGQVDGDLTVNKKLTILSSGRISGSVRYGSIIIEAGGEVSGDMQALDMDDKDSSPV